MPATRSNRRDSLADLAVGDSAIIGYVLFELIRGQVASLGLSDGERVTCTGSDPFAIHVRGPRGNEIAIDRFLACFIEVDPCSDAMWRPEEELGNRRKMLARC